MAGSPSAELVRAEGTVDGQGQTVSAPLEEGDLVNVGAGGVAVIEYRDGCRYTVTGNVEYMVNHAQCICYESLDASKHSRHDAVAELGYIDGKALLNKGANHLDKEPRVRSSRKAIA